MIDLENKKTVQAQEISSFKKRVKRLEKKRRIGKDFSRRDTPLFTIMLVPAQEEELDEALNEENVPAHSNDPPLSRVNILRSGEDRLKLKELMEICTNLQQRVIDLENKKTVQAQEISSFKNRVKRLEKKRRSKTHGLKRLYKIGLSARVESYANEQSLSEENASKQGRNIPDIEADAEITLMKLQRIRGEPSKTPTTTTILISSKVQDKGKGIMVEEPLKMKKKDQISFDKQEAKRLQAEIDKQDRLAEEKAQLIEDENLA
nr:hypothetical protein [Tanacetum cinerariifolium]